jgi:hypothetical protein
MKIFLRLIYALVGLAVLVSGFLWFIFNLIFTFSVSYRFLFWLSFLVFVLLSSLFVILFLPWAKKYAVYIFNGTNKDFAFREVCQIIKFRPPKVILRSLEPLLLKLGSYFLFRIR